MGSCRAPSPPLAAPRDRHAHISTGTTGTTGIRAFIIAHQEAAGIHFPHHHPPPHTDTPTLPSSPVQCYSLPSAEP
jgi:hypothetical protein